MSNLEKNTRIKEAGRLTRLKRSGQVCKTFRFKISKNRLSKVQAEHLKMLFVESKWTYNWLLANLDNLDDPYDVNKTYKLLTNITHKDKNGNDVSVTISHLGSSMKQELVKQISTEITVLSKLKKRGHTVGKLKFKSEYNSINLKQYGISHELRGNKFKIQGIKQLISVRGIQQLSKYNNIDYTNAKLLYDGIDYFISLTCYIDKNEITHNTVYNNDILGLDFGIKTNITCSNGEKIDVFIEESERLKKLQARQSRKKKGSNNRYKLNCLIRKEYRHLNNKKNDIANKLVHRLLSENKIVVMQDEQINKWKNELTSNEIQHSILGRLKSKLVSHERVVVLDKFFPTTKYCSNCGHKNDTITLSDRIFVCPNCNKKEDRDIHAANNMIYFYLKYKDTAGTVDTSKPVLVEFSDSLVKQENTTSLALC